MECRNSAWRTAYACCSHALTSLNQHRALAWRISLVFLLGLSSNTLKSGTLESIHIELGKPQTFNVDFASKPELIAFRWQYLHADSLPSSAMGRQWRHNFDIRLLQDGDSLVLIDSLGLEHPFSSDAGNIFLPKSAALGSIYKSGSYHIWRTIQNETTFFGSYPVNIQPTNGLTHRLRYDEGLLREVFNDNGDTLVFSYKKNRLLSNVTWRDERSIIFDHDKYNRLASSNGPDARRHYSYSSAPPVMVCLPDDANANNTEVEQTQTETADKLCDNDEAAPSKTFQDLQPSAYGIKIDLRPEQCNSYFDEYSGIDRGVQIERGMPLHSRYQLWQSTVRNFPIVDFIDGRQAVAVLSKALDSKSYSIDNHPEGLFNSILQDAIKADTLFIQKLNRFGFVTAKEKGITTTINAADIDSLRVELVIQAGQASSGHYAQIERARQVLKERFDIDLLVVHIP